MKNIAYMIMMVSVLFLASCELEEGEDKGDSYDEDYAQKWYKATELVADTSWNIDRLDLSDQSFEVSEAELDSNTDLSDYRSDTKGDIDEVDSNTLELTVRKKFFNDEWLSYEEYVELQEDLGQSETQAIALADAIYITIDVDYQIGSDPETLTISGTNEFSGIYYTSELTSVINN